MANKSISQLDAAALVNNDDLFETAQPDLSSASGYTSAKQSLAAIADHIATQVVYPSLGTTAQSIVGAINELCGIVLTDTLTAGSTSLVLSDNAITTSSTLDIYTDTYGVNPTAVVVATGSITLSFKEQSSDVAVKVRVS